MAALLAGEHGDYLAACKQFAEVAEDEAPGPSEAYPEAENGPGYATQLAA